MKINVKHVQKILKPRSQAVEVFLKSFLPNQEPKEVYGVIREFMFRGGKRIRAALVMLGAATVGGSEKKVVPLAGAIEMFHAFTLVHDDIMDESELRRGKPCLHRTFGTPLAINAGDVLGMMVLPALQGLTVSCQTRNKLEAFLWIELLKIFEGQAMELSWIRVNKFSITEKDYFTMVEKKTAVLLGAAIQLGAFLAGGTKREQKYLYEFGRLAGVAFQIRDDILNLVGEEQKYQKEIGGDITEGKRSLITIHAFNNGTKPERQRLQKILSLHTRDQKLIREAITITEKLGSVAYAQRIVEKYTRAAFVQLQKLPQSKAREELEVLTNFLLTREQ